MNEGNYGLKIKQIFMKYFHLMPYIDKFMYFKNINMICTIATLQGYFIENELKKMKDDKLTKT